MEGEDREGEKVGRTEEAGGFDRSWYAMVRFSYGE
jgi:hypothetical protein